MSLRNSLFDASNALVRAVIKSPDFVTNVKGWALGKDGSAEFNNVRSRGKVTVSNGVSTIQMGPNVDPLVDGSALLFTDTRTGGTTTITMSSDGTLNIRSANGPNFASLLVGAQDIMLQTFNNDAASLTAFDITPAGHALGNNTKRGKHYVETVSIPGNIVVPNDTSTTVTGLSLAAFQENDYPSSAWDLVNGIWTAPDDGTYDFTYKQIMAAWGASNTAPSSLLLSASLNGTLLFNQEIATRFGLGTANSTESILKGNTVVFSVRHNRGSSLNTLASPRSRITVARRN